VATFWFSSTSFPLKHSAGYARAITTALSQSRRVSDAPLLDKSSLVFSYFSVIGVGYYPLVATSGSSVLILEGNNFANRDVSFQSSKMGYSFSETSKWASDSAVLNKITSGFSRNAHIVFTQGRQISVNVYTSTYQTALISNNQELQIPCSGKFYIYAFGMNSMKNDASQSLRLGRSVNEFSKWLSDSSMLLKLGQGAGLNRAVFSVERQAWSIKAFFSYSVIQYVKKVHPVNAPSTGATSSTINGAMFGVADFTISFRFGGTATEAVSWISDSHVVLKTPNCLHRNPSFTISLLIQIKSFVNTTIFDKPQAPITAKVVPSNSATTASTMLTMLGSGLGLADQTQATRLLESGLSVTRWRSESCIRSRMISGTSALLSLVFSLNPLLRDIISNTFTYDVSMHQFVNSLIQPSSGSTWIAIRTSSIGLHDSTLVLSLKFSRTESTNWICDSRIDVKLSASTTSSVQVLLSCSSQLSSSVGKFSFQLPLATVVNPKNMPSTGLSSLLLNGISYGRSHRSASVRFGTTAATSTTWTSFSMIYAKCAAGTGSGIFTTMVVTNALSRALLTRTLSFNLPGISFVKFQNTFALTITGRGFGNYASGRTFSSQGFQPIWLASRSSSLMAENDISSLKTGYLLFSIQIEIELVNFTRIDDVTIIIVHPSGRQTKLFGSQCFGCYGGYMKFSFADGSALAPQTNCPINGVYGTSTSLNALLTDDSFGIWKLLISTDSTTITVLSASINIFASSLVATFAGSPAESLTWTSDTFFNTLAPRTGAGKNRLVAVMAATQQSIQSHTFTYPTPILTQLSNLVYLTTASSVLTLSGIFFSAAATTVNARTAASSCGGSFWVSQSCIRCRLTSGILPGSSASVTVNDLRNSMSAAFLYVKPGITSVLTALLAVTGGQILSIRGTAFAVHSPTPAHRAGLTSASSSVWISDSSMIVKSFASNQATGMLFVTALFQSSSKWVASFSEPLMSSNSKPSNVPSTGRNILVIEGASFGTVGSSNRVKIVASTASNTLWTSDSLVRCRSTIGVNVLLTSSVHLSVGSLVGLQQSAFIRNEPFSVFAASFLNANQSFAFDRSAFGSTGFGQEYYVDETQTWATYKIFGFNGSNFGSINFSPRMKVSGTICDFPLWVSDSTMFCKYIPSRSLRRLQFIAVEIAYSVLPLPDPVV
jgi:hypothetical protein